MKYFHVTIIVLDKRDGEKHENVSNQCKENKIMAHFVFINEDETLMRNSDVNKLNV